MSGAPKHDKERGAILLTTMLIMAMMATLAVAIMSDIRIAVLRAGNVNTAEQLDWYARGAEDFAQVWLSEQNSENQSTLAAIIRAGQAITFPLDEGTLSIKIRDGQNCFNVNALAEKDSLSARRELLNLLDSLGVGASDALLFSERLTDWVDADSSAGQGGAENYTYLAKTPAYLAANRPMADITELRAIDGVSEAFYRQIRPYVCAPQTDRTEQDAAPLSPSRININTLGLDGGPLLASVLGGRDALPVAEAIIADMPAEGYGALEEVLTRQDFIDLDLKGSANARLSVRSQRIEIEIGIAQGGQFRSYAVQFLTPRVGDAVLLARRAQF